MDYIAVPVQLILDTPNNMELGEKVRQLLTQFGGISEHTKPCTQEKEDQ